MPDDLITADPADGGATRRKLLTGMGAAAAGGGLLALAGAQQAQAAVGNAAYFSLGPLRILDTRESGGRISGGQTRTLREFEGSDDLTWAINLTVTSTKGSGYLSLYNADVPRPRPYSTINWRGSGKSWPTSTSWTEAKRVSGSIAQATQAPVRTSSSTSSACSSPLKHLCPPWSGLGRVRCKASRASFRADLNHQTRRHPVGEHAAGHGGRPENAIHQPTDPSTRDRATASVWVS